MLIQFYKKKGRRLLSLLLALTMLLPNFTGMVSAAEQAAGVDPACGIAEHIHGDACVESVSQTVCGLQEGETHVHLDDCYQIVQNVICTLQEHTHSESCYVALMSDDEAVEETTPSSGLYTGGSNDISGYTVELEIFNNLYRTGAAGGADIMSQNDVFTLSGAFGQTITVGGKTDETDENRKPKANDIIVELAGLNVGNTVTINDVYPAQSGDNKTVLNITAASALSSLVLGANAAVELNVNADLTISALTLSDNSSLTITIKEGCQLTLTDTNGAGSLSISGGTVVGSKLSAKTLSINAVNVTMPSIRSAEGMTLNNATITAQDGTLVAGEIDAVGTIVNGAQLFGFDETVTGTARLNFVNCRFNNVLRVGAADNCTAQVRFASECSVAVEAKTYVRDYTVTYVTIDGNNGDNWITSYRVSSDTLNGMGEVLTQNTELPVYTTPGYTYQGWKTAPDATSFITNLSGQQGDLTLYPQTKAATITIYRDLLFNVDHENCDDADSLKEIYNKISGSNTNVAQTAQELDTTLTLDTPNRFGYTFIGWKLSDTETLISDTEYQIVYNQLTDKENYVLKLEAVWQKDTFPLYWSFSGIDLGYMELSLDGGTTWSTPLQFAENHTDLWTWEESSSSLRTTQKGEIMYGESLDAYFARLNTNWETPILRDKRAQSAQAEEVLAAQAFRAWYWNNHVLPVYASNTFDTAAETGILRNTKNDTMTWAEYQTAYLKLGNPVTLTSVFGTADYHVNIGADTGWTYQVNGVTQVPKNGFLVVPNGATVTLSCTLTSGMVISNWEFLSRSAITVKERYPGGATVFYDFIMPACDVTATYQKKVGARYVDIANGAITFEEDADPTRSGLKRDGFWHKGLLVSDESANYSLPLAGMTPLAHDAAKGYFYIWDMSQEFYVTSDGVATTNQLTLVETTKVRLNAVNMTDRDAYTRHAVGREIFDYSVEIPRDSSAANKGQSVVANEVNGAGHMGDLGNIVLADDASVVQTFTLTFEGSHNYVASVFSDRYYYGANNKLNIKGTGNASLTLGTAFANCSFEISNISITENNSPCDYLFHAVAQGGAVTISGAAVTAPHKEIYVKDAVFTVSSKAVVDIGVVVAGSSMSVGENSKVRVRGDVYCGYAQLAVGKNSITVIDGNYLINYYHWNSDNKRGATGAYVIVKGNRCEFGNVRWTAGTLICNTLVFGRCGGIQGGTVIANQITNPPMLNWQISAGETEYKSAKAGYTSKVTANGDTYPFLTYAQHSKTNDTFRFSGGTTYLLGYSSSGTYDPSIVVNDTPVGTILASLLDENGNYNGATIDRAAVLDAVQNSANKANECFVLGNSTYTTETIKRTVEITGSAKIYAAGNITLFNDTTVGENAEIWCGGTFGSKNELTISGGTVTAKEIGIAYDLKTTLEDGTIRWKKLTISDGAIHADRVGTLSTCVSNNAKVIRGAADIDIGCINPNSGTETTLEFDEYVNYLLGTAGFDNSGENLEIESIHISGSVRENVASYSANPMSFAAPVCDGENGTWKLGTTAGETVDGINADADMTLDGTSLSVTAHDSDRLVLVAVKEQYSISVKAGSVYIADLHGAGAVTATRGKAGNEVTIRISDPAYAADRTVVWYIDANGSVCNPGCTVNDNTISFVMPYNDVEVYVAPEGMELDLSQYHVTVLADGFRTNLADVAGNQDFHYTGSLTITQSLAAETEYRIRVLKNVNNLESDRDFTLTAIHQRETSADVGLLLEDGAKARFLIRGNVELCRVEVTENSNIILRGEDADRENNRLTIQRAPGFDAVENATALGNNHGLIGNITLDNLRIEDVNKRLPAFCINGSVNRSDTNAYDKYKNPDATVIYKNCNLTASIWYSGSSLAGDAGHVIIEGCNFEITPDKSWPASLFYDCDYVDIKESNIRVLNSGGSSSNATDLFYGISQQMTITDSEITTTLRRSTASATYRFTMSSGRNAPTLMLDGDTVFNSQERLYCKNLILEDGSVLNLGTNLDGYLFASNLQVRDNASINADTILVSGYSTSSKSNEDEVISNLSAKSPSIRDGSSGGLFMSGGSVNAKNVGGDYNTVIEVSGGILRAERIGTLGALYGYATYIPQNGEKWMYTYAKVPTAATVTISGGTVNVADYMGGMNSKVNIQGGLVNLGSGATLGMTDEHAQTLKTYYDTQGVDIVAQKAKNVTINITGGEVLGDGGTINTPYGTATISGADTGVQVQNISAVYGDVTIRESTNRYNNGLTGKQPVGVHVGGLLTAQNITISGNAKVFAAEALANAPEVDDRAALNVLDESVLFTHTYGSSGQGGVTIVGKENVNIIQQQRQYAITYILNDDTIDPASNHASNPDTFIFDSTNQTTVLLEPASRDNFEFVTWYAYAGDGSVIAMDSFSCNTPYDVVLYAEWKPKEVKFQVYVDTDTTYVGTDVEIRSMGSAIDVEDNIIRFSKIVSVPYRENIFGADGTGIVLDDYHFPSYVIQRLQVTEEDISYDLEPASSTVTKELLACYEAKAEEDINAVIRLKAVRVSKRNEMVTMDLNLQNSRPVGAQFQENNAYVSGNTIYARVAVGDTIASAEGLVINGKLNQPTAPGYTFLHWNTEVKGTGTEIDEGYTIGGDSAITFYAQWNPNQYTIQFNSNGGFVTKINESVLSGESTLKAYVVYDTEIDGHISYEYGNREQTNALPFAWKPGYQFLGWAVADSDVLIGKEQLNEDTFGDMNLEKPTEDKVILTLTAVYAPLTVIYHTDGGIFTEAWINKTNATELRDNRGGVIGWKSETKDGVVGYGLPLAGYGRNLVIAPNGEYELSKEQPSEAGYTYAVLSTTAKYYQENGNTFFAGDYRSEIGKKGYTFRGWNTKPDGSGEYVGTLPAYNDIHLYAQWSKNTYTLVLNRGESSYSDLLGQPCGADLKVTVTVGELIDGTQQNDISKAIAENWSDRDDQGWYAIAKNTLENVKQDRRFILGFTFDKLEPGAPSNDVNDTTSDHSVAYRNYAANVTNLINNNALLTKVELLKGIKTEGSIFHLPADDEYHNGKVNGTRVVPDYPNGYTIQMYAVYRERSLVFIQRYVDMDEQLRQKVMASAPYNTYSNYPDLYATSDAHAQVANQGYSLVRWSVNDPQTGDTYPSKSTEYTNEKVNGWISAANTKGSYDINVYTVYAANVTDSIELIATSEPDDIHAESVEYPIPGSMVADEINYTITKNSALEIVSLSELQEAGNRYDAGRTKYVAISMELIDPAGNPQETLWLTQDQNGAHSTVAAGKGWKLRFTMYHSRVISQTEELPFVITMTFPDENAQQIVLNTTAKLVPTKWIVNYTANLPIGDDHLVVQNNGYSGAGDTRTSSDYGWVYGTALKGTIPTVEGYRGIGHWNYSAAETFEYGKEGTMRLTSPGAIYLSTIYQIQSYQLTDSTNGKCSIVTAGSVEYHKAITIDPGATNAAFIWLEFDGERYRLDQLKNEAPFYAEVVDGVYTVLMPAGDVNVAYDDVMELYLGYDSISITPDAYTYQGETVQWPGNYTIYQWPQNAASPATPNVLNLCGALSSRTIKLGNLDITSVDSIVLAESTAVTLTATGSINAKNIMVPETAILTLQSDDAQVDRTVNLAPAKDQAAIGGSGNTGNITVRNLDLMLDMPAGSAASGIGSGNSESASAGVITVESCDITVLEENIVGVGAYSGDWIGGKKAGSVMLTETTLSNYGSESNIAMANGDTVKIQDCTVGAQDARIKNHTLRGGTIAIDNSDIYLTGNNVVLLCPENTLSVDLNYSEQGDGSIINIEGYHTMLYLNKLMIGHAETDIVVYSTRLLDLNNGDITITKSSCAQSGISCHHEGGYRLISAFSDYADTSNLTVQSLNAGMFITAEASCKIDTLTVSGDTDLRPLGLMQVDDVTIAEGKLLEIAAETGAGLNPIRSFGGDGSYIQTGGALISQEDLTVGGDLTLKNVAVETQKSVGSSGANGVTTVSITKSTVTANIIGAAGEHSDSFTFVELDNESVLNGMLVQDHYRLHYNLSDSNFKMDGDLPYATETEKLPTVLRSKTAYTTTKGNTEYLPSIPEDPYYPAGESYFSSWYIETGSVRTALSSTDVVGFSQKATLSDGVISYTADTRPSDGTKTLEVYAWMNLNGTGVIAYGRELNRLNKAETTVIETDGAWTARFDVSGVVLKNAQYQFTFGTAIPAGTKLVLRFGENNPIFYRYITTEAVSVVKEGDFVRMGTDSEHASLMTEVGSTMEHVLQLSADFAEAAAVANGVALTVESNSGSHPIATVSYTVKTAAEASCEANEKTVSYIVAPNGDSRLSGTTLYLVAQLKKNGENISVPYNAKLLWNGKVGTWLGGDTVYFTLGEYGQKQFTDIWSVSGLEGGNYTVTWYLTAAKGNVQNVFGRILAQSETVAFAAPDLELPALDVNLISVNGEAPGGYVLSGETRHNILFAYETNMADVQVLLEKQGTLQRFTAVTDSSPAEATGTTVTIPAEAGVYRISFSLDGFGDTSSPWDDAYYTFIVK